MKKEQFNYNKDSLLSPVQIQKIWGVSRPTFEKLAERADFPKALQISDKIRRWYKKDLDLWLEHRTRI